VVHKLDLLLWQQTKDGQKGRNQPPLPPILGGRPKRRPPKPLDPDHARAVLAAIAPNREEG
jgi:hypothetical protein